MFFKMFSYDFKTSGKSFLLTFLVYFVVYLLLLNTTGIDRSYASIENSVQSFFTYSGTLGIVIIVIIFQSVRYLRVSLFDDASYLTHTLPIKLWQSLISKLLSLTLWLIITMFFVTITTFFGLYIYNFGFSGLFSRFAHEFLNNIALQSIGEITMNVFVSSFFFLSLVLLSLSLTHSSLIRWKNSLVSVLIGIILYIGIALLMPRFGTYGYDDSFGNILSHLRIQYLIVSSILFGLSTWVISHKLEL